MICKVVIILLSTLILLANYVKCYQTQNEDFEFIEDEPKSHFDQDNFKDFSYDDDESENTEIFEQLSRCKPCDLVNHTGKICGSDGKTYESICQLNLTNCLNESKITVSCETSCPCKEKKIPKFKANKLYLQKKHRYYYDMINKLEQKDSKVIKKKKTETNENPELNEVYVERKYKSDKCKTSDAMKSMGIRLLEWFTVLMNDPMNSIRQKHIRINHQFPKYCKHEVKWMFDYLDNNSDGLLEPKELRDLENYPYETCLKPFLLSCDFNVDARVSIKEWCRCFVNFDRKFFNQNIDNFDYFDNDDDDGGGDDDDDDGDDNEATASGDDLMKNDDPILDF